MEKLNRDEIGIITDKLTPIELIYFCSSGVNKLGCNSNDFWYRRFNKDYSFLSSFFSRFKREC